MNKIIKCVIYLFKFLCGCTKSCEVSDEHFMHI